MSEQEYVNIDEETLVEIENHPSILTRLRNHIKTKIPRDKEVIMRCTCPPALWQLCERIGRKEKTSAPKAYAALVHVGHGMVLYRGARGIGLNFEHLSAQLEELNDTFTDRSYIIMEGLPTIMNAEGDSLRIRFNENLSEWHQRIAGNCNIKVSNLCLYYALVGLEELVDRAPKYQGLKDFTSVELLFYRRREMESQFEAMVGYIDADFSRRADAVVSETTSK